MTVMDSKMFEHGGGKGWSLCRRLWGEQVNVQSRRTSSQSGAWSSEESPRDHHDHHLHHHHHHYHPHQQYQLQHQQQQQQQHHHQYHHDIGDSLSFKSLTRALLHRRRLSFEPNKKLFFPYEPGKQATSAVKIRNVCRSHNVAFKFQTTAPKSCFMRPPYGVLLPGESIVATVVKHIHRAQRARTNQAKDKFKIVSLKMFEGAEFVPELFDDLKDHVIVEQILRVHFLDPEQPTSELEKLKVRIAEADAANEACKKSVEEKAPPRVVGHGNILEEWNKMKQARQIWNE